MKTEGEDTQDEETDVETTEPPRKKPHLAMDHEQAKTQPIKNKKGLEQNLMVQFDSFAWFLP